MITFIKFTINREKFKTELGKITYDKLLSISKDTNFLISVLIDVKGDEKKRDLLEWLEIHPNATDEDVENYIYDKYYAEE